jgi:hypothetical protein
VLAPVRDLLVRAKDLFVAAKSCVACATLGRFTVIGLRKLVGARGFSLAAPQAEADPTELMKDATPSCHRPWAELAVAAELRADLQRDGRLTASYEGQCRCAFAFFPCRQGNISEHTRRLLRRTVLCRPCNALGDSEVLARRVRERACIATRIAGT